MRLVVLLTMTSLLAGCLGGPKASDYQAKIDSLRQAEQLKELKQQGLYADDSNPFRVFYEMLSIQPLPVSYSENYVNTCPNYLEVPETMAELLNLEEYKNMKAIALPERANARLMMVATVKEEVVQELWLYSLDLSYLPVDQICLYDISEGIESNFAVTSDYEIYRNDVGYYVDSDYRFQEYIEKREDPS